MKASELIEKLQAAIAEHGDLLVVCWDDKEQTARVVGVSPDNFEYRHTQYVPALMIDAE